MVSDAPSPASPGDLNSPARPVGLGRRLGKMPITLLLIGINLLFFYVLTDPGQAAQVIADWGLSAEKVREGELYRLLSNHFLHIGPFAGYLSLILSILIVFLSLGSRIEAAIGPRATLILSLQLMLMEPAVNLLLPRGLLAGIGGRCFFLGYIGAFLGYIYTDRGSLKALLRDRGVWQIAFMIGLYLALDWTLTDGNIPYGPWAALVLGAVSTTALTRLSWPDSKARRGAWIRTAILSLGVALTTFAAVKPEQASSLLGSGRLLPGVEPRSLLTEGGEPVPEDEKSALIARAEGLEAKDEHRLERGLLLLKAGAASRALPELQRAAALEPKDPLRQAILGRAYLAASNPIEAREVLEQAARLDPEDAVPEIAYWRAMASRHRPQRYQELMARFLEKIDAEDPRYAAMVARARESQSR